MDQTELSKLGKSLNEAGKVAAQKYDAEVQRKFDETREVEDEKARKWIVQQRKSIIDRIRQVLAKLGSTKDGNVKLPDTWVSLDSAQPFIDLRTPGYGHLSPYAVAFKKSLYELAEMLGFRKIHVHDTRNRGADDQLEPSFDIRLYLESRDYKPPKVDHLEIDDTYTRLAKKRAAGNDDDEGVDDIKEILGSNKRAKTAAQVIKENEDEKKPAVQVGNSDAGKREDETSNKGDRESKVKQGEYAGNGDDSGFVAS